MSPLPILSQYQETIQNPNVCFLCPDLKTCSVEKDNWGIPRVRSGGFALTFKLINQNGSWAVRCFHKSVPDRENRYKAISRFLRQKTSDIFYPVNFLQKGIHVQGDLYPITYMPWVNGETLGTFLDKNFKNRDEINSLLPKFMHVVDELDDLQIAHGDLSGANLIVNPSRMALVDYDGMFLPEFKGLQSNETGNKDFQHPRRTADYFNADMDRFSSIVIFLALLALKKDPLLWKKYGTGEGLLFSQKDFVDPNHSKLLMELSKYQELSTLIEHFKIICQSDVNHVPQLKDFLAANKPLGIISELTKIPQRQLKSQYPVLSALDKNTILSLEGEMVTVVGKITDVHLGHTQSGPNPGSPYYFFNFSFWKNNHFTIVAWSEVLELFQTFDIQPQRLKNEWISVTGIINIYQERPEIILASPKDMEILGGEEEATQLLKNYNTPEESATADESISNRLEKFPPPQANYSPVVISPPPKTNIPIRPNANSVPSSPIIPNKATSIKSNYPAPSAPTLSSATPPPSLQKINKDLEIKINQLWSNASQTPVKSANQLPLSPSLIAITPIVQSGLPKEPLKTKSNKKMFASARLIWIFIICLAIIAVILIVLSSRKPLSYEIQTTSVQSYPENSAIQTTSLLPTYTPSVQPTPKITKPIPTRVLTITKVVLAGCTTGTLKLRTVPNETSKVVSFLPVNTCLTIDEISEDGYWYHAILHPNSSQTGWVAVKWIKLFGNPHLLPHAKEAVGIKITP